MLRRLATSLLFKNKMIWLALIGVVIGTVIGLVLIPPKKSKDPEYEPVQITDQKVPVTLVCFVRKDLQMGKGKIAAQVCHGIEKVLKQRKKPGQQNQKWDRKIQIYSIKDEAAMF